MTALVFTSCGKKCVCTRFEDGQKIVTQMDDEARYFETSACTEQSVDKFMGYSIVTDGKEVEVEIVCK